MGYGTTKAEAAAEGKKLLSKLKGTGWKLSLWQNLGWCFKVTQGPVSVHETCGKYWAMVSDNPNDASFGANIWTEARTRSYADPNKAVARAIKLARDMLGELTEAVEAAEAVLPERTARCRRRTRETCRSASRRGRRPRS